MNLELFAFTVGASKAVPVFSSERGARQFVQRYVAETSQVLPFAIGEEPVGAVVGEPGTGMALVVDPGTSNEWELTTGQMAALMKRWT